MWRLGGSESKEVVLVTHDSFAIPKEVKAAFEQESGLKLTILQGGDAGEMVNRALLTKGNPQGDVLFGIDNNLLSRALGEGLFEPYDRERARPGRSALPDRPEPPVTPIDHGDVCLNVDRNGSPRTGSPRRRRLADLTDPRYRNLLVVENPATSTPGLAFMLATIAQLRRGRLAGLLAPPARERRSRRRRLGGGVHSAVLRCRRQQGQAADRRLLRDEPGGRGHLRDEAADDGADGCGRRDSCFRQIELAGVLDGREERDGCAGVDRFHARGAVPGIDPGEHVRAPRARRHAAVGGIRAVRRLPAAPARAAPGRDRQQPRSLDRRVDTVVLR